MTERELAQQILARNAAKGWTYCKDELPPIGVEVLLAYAWQDHPVQGYRTESGYMASREIRDLMRNSEGDAELIMQEDIYAWFKLPTPPPLTNPNPKSE